MRRGAKPKPAALLQLHGTHSHRPRLPDAEAPGDVGEPPAVFSKAEQELWREALAVAPFGVFKAADRAMLRQWCALQAQFEEANRQQQKLNERRRLPFLVRTKAGELVVISPYVHLMIKLRGRFIQMAQIMGYCPSGRVGLMPRAEADVPDGQDNGWIKLEQMRRAAANVR